MTRIVVVTFVGLFIGVAPAHADALDGDWCHPVDGKLTIDGPKIQTPGGKSVVGNYSRHRFEYTAPEGDWQANKSIVIQQFNERLMELTVADQPGQKWRPCQVVS